MRWRNTLLSCSSRNERTSIVSKVSQDVILSKMRPRSNWRSISTDLSILI